jgi:hypothetical protein
VTIRTQRATCRVGSDCQPVLEVGVYLGKHRLPLPCEVECPYCHELMIETQPLEPPTRIVKVLRALKSEPGEQCGEVMVHDIPDSHRVLACEQCRAIFTMPKVFASALSADAVARAEGIDAG